MQLALALGAEERDLSRMLCAMEINIFGRNKANCSLSVHRPKLLVWPVCFPFIGSNITGHKLANSGAPNVSTQPKFERPE
jgi:hypothetical protein